MKLNWDMPANTSGKIMKSSVDHPSINQNNGVVTWLARGGVFAAILYLGTYLILSSLEPGYDHFKQFPSELGSVDAKYFPLMNLMFSLTGLLTIGLAIGLHLGLTEGKGSIAGPLLLGVLGLSLFLAGFFPCAEGCQPTTFSSKGHRTVGLPGLFGFLLAPFFVWRRLLQDSLWRKFSYFSLSMGILAVVMVMGGFSFASIFGEEYVPIITKVLLIPQLGWPFGMAIILLKVSKQ
jgi:hypothetical membrane protein